MLSFHTNMFFTYLEICMNRFSTRFIPDNRNEIYLFFCFILFFFFFFLFYLFYRVSHIPYISEIFSKNTEFFFYFLSYFIFVLFVYFFILYSIGKVFCYFGESEVLQNFSNMRHNLAALDTFAGAVKVMNHTGLWDTNLAWYSLSTTHLICLYGLEYKNSKF